MEIKSVPMVFAVVNMVGAQMNLRIAVQDVNLSSELVVHNLNQHLQPQVQHPPSMGVLLDLPQTVVRNMEIKSA